MSTLTEPTEKTPPRRTRLRAWGTLLATLAVLWAFAVVIGPWVQARVPAIDRAFQTINEQDINANAYFYTEIAASYDGERYLRESRRLTDPEHSGVTLPFLSGIILCIVILGIGFRYLPED